MPAGGQIHLYDITNRYYMNPIMEVRQGGRVQALLLHPPPTRLQNWLPPFRIRIQNKGWTQVQQQQS